METGTAVGLGVLLLVVVGVGFIILRPTTIGPSLTSELPGATRSEAADIITASGGAVGSILSGVGSLYGSARATDRQASGKAVGA